MRTSAVALAAAAALAFAAPAGAAPLAWSGLKPISPDGSPYPPGCARSTTGTNYPGTEVEPWVAVNPRDPDNVLAAWQQDRYSNGGANGLRAAYTTDGSTWSLSAPAGFTRCDTGNPADYERASDPWVAFSADGAVAYFMALTFDQSADLDNGMQVTRSTDGGATWERPRDLIRDTSPTVLDDKNSLTADRFDASRAYAIWDRLVFPNERTRGKSYENAAAYYGPTYLSTTSDQGVTWSPARKIWDPGQEHHNSGRNDQSIGNQIVQTSDGTLVDVFDWINNDNGGGGKGYKVAVIRSTDHGATWSNATVVARFTPGTVHDPTTGDPVRSGDIIPEIAYDPRDGSNTVYAVWQGASASSPSSVYLSRSTDAGRSWSAPHVIDTVTSVQAFTPSVRVRPDGSVAVTYYDFRNDDASPPLTTDYWSIVSRDGGETWEESHVSGPFDQRTAAVARGYFLGDYEGLGGDEHGDVLRSVFAQSNGTPPVHSEDIEESDGD